MFLLVGVLFYPLSKILLAFFGLNWLTWIDFQLYLLMLFSLFFLILLKIMGFLRSGEVKVLIFLLFFLLGVIPCFFLIYGYGFAATTDSSDNLDTFIHEQGQTYIIGREFLSMSHSYEHRYRAYPPFFRALEADDYDIWQMNERYFGKPYEEGRE